MTRTSKFSMNRTPLLLPVRDEPYVLADVLEKVVHDCREEVILSFENCNLQFGVDPNTDSISALFHPMPFRAKKGYRSVQSTKPWKKLAGKDCCWTWLAWNQQGYLDSVMLAFDGIEPGVLLQSIASSIEVYVVSRVNQAMESTDNGNGKHATKPKR